MSEYFNSEHLGKTKFTFWYGQVLGDWEGNENPEVHDREDVPGWGKRYKVLMFGQDPKFIKDGLKNNEAVMAEVLLPTTAGSGIGGGTMTPSIGQNTYVMGYYKDGINSREPVILGLIPNVPQTELFKYDKNEEEARYFPATGYDPSKEWHLVSNLKILADGTGTSENTDPNVNYVERHIQLQDGVKVDYIPKTYDCDGPKGQLKGVQNIIQNGLNATNKINSETNSFLNAATALPTSISSIIDSVSNGVSSFIKEMIQNMRNYTLNQFNSVVASSISLIPPNLRPNLRIANEAATDTLNCVFNKITKLLLGLVTSAFMELIGGVSASICSVLDVVGSVLSNILGDITSAIDSALSSISGILGKVVDFAGNVLSALDIISNTLKFFSCEEPLKCPDIDEWSFWYGPQKMSENVSESIYNALGSSGGSCSSAPVLCGPPQVNIISSTGGGFSANPIISGSGALLAFDVFNNGSNYIQNPSVSFGNNCGTGNGAVILPVVNSSGGSINDLIILDTGVAYLQSPNGSTGAGQNKFSNPEDTIVYDGQTYSVIPPNTEISLNVGEVVQVISGPGLNNRYPVALEIKDIYITNPGINYNDNDNIVITPDLGSELTPVFDDAGRLIKVAVDSPGIGFTERPNIYINSTTGINARMVPVFNVIRLSELENTPAGISIIDVVDCVGEVYDK